MEHVVSRAALRSPVGTPEPASEPDLSARSNIEYTYVDHDVPLEPRQDEEQLDFRLFASAETAQKNYPHKIRLRSPTPTTAAAGFVRPRSNSSYFADVSEVDFAKAAPTGEQILAQSRIPWPGTALPWKLLHAASKVTDVQSLPGVQRHMDAILPGKRRRLGKKSRIKLRTKIASEHRREDATRAAVEAKEAAEREKKTRRNREKKVKKRLREKAKKVEARAEDDQSSSDSG